MKIKNSFIFTLALTFITFPLIAKESPPIYGSPYYLPHKIHKVTTYSDSALIERLATIESKYLKKKNNWLHFSTLPYNMDKQSIRVKVLSPSQLKISQVVIEDSYEYKELDPSVKSKVEELKELYANKLEIIQRLSLINEKFNFVKNLKFSAPFDKKNENYQAFNAPLSQINSAMDLTVTHSNKTLKEIENHKEKLNKLNEKIEFLLKHIKSNTNLDQQKWISHVYVLLDNKNNISEKKSKIQLSYNINNSKWHPVYDIRADLDKKNGKANIRLITAGLIEQKTGENWKNVDVTLSTKSPVPLYLPVLNRWSFQEQREESFEDKSYGSKAESAAMDMAQAPMKREKSRGRRKSRQAKKIARSNFKPNSMRSQSVGAPGGGMRGNMAMEMDEETFAQNAAPYPSTRVVKNSYNKDSSNNTRFPLSNIENIFSDYAQLKNQLDRLAYSKANKNYYLPQRINLPRKKHYNDSTLPAVQAAGRLIEMKSPFKIDLDSDAAPLKIPVHAQLLKGDLIYFTIPKKDKRVFLRTKTINTTKVPLLAGKAQIFMDGDLVSKTQLNTIHEDSFFLVELGVDKNIKTQRIVTKQSKTEGMVFKEHSTEVLVKIEIANSHSFPINLEIKDHYPLSPNEKIKIELIEMSPKPINKKYGLLQWKDKVGGNKKKIYTFKYRVTHPENYLVSDFN